MQVTAVPILITGHSTGRGEDTPPHSFAAGHRGTLIHSQLSGDQALTVSVCEFSEHYEEIPIIFID